MEPRVLLVVSVADVGGGSPLIGGSVAGKLGGFFYDLSVTGARSVSRNGRVAGDQCFW